MLNENRLRGASFVAMLGLAAAVAGIGCGTKTSTTQLWQAQNIRPSTMQRVIVFGGGMAEPERRSIEDGLSASLQARGVGATPSYVLFPELPNAQHARGEVQQRGYEGAIVATIRGTEEKESYVPGYYHGGTFWGGYYGPGWGMGYTPGYVVTDEYVNVETSLWDLRTEDGALVWSAVTKTMNPSSGKDLVNSLSKEIVPKMSDAGYFPRPAKK